MKRTLLFRFALALVFPVTMAGCAATTSLSPAVVESQQTGSLSQGRVAPDATVLAITDAASKYKYIKIPTSNSIQTSLISTFPQGIFKPAKGWASFSIPSKPKTCGYTNGSACNFYDGFSGDGASIRIKPKTKAQKYAYTLMNAYGPPAGVQIATIKFFGGHGASVTFSLIAGKDIRDFYNGSYANSLSNGVSGVVAKNVFQCRDPKQCLGAGGTGDVHTGLSGTYRIDEQRYDISALRGQTVTKVVVTDTTGGTKPILLGLTM